MNSNRDLKLGIAFSYITMVVNVIISILYTPFLLRSLGTQQYGLYNMGQSAIAYLSLAEFGFGNAVVRYSSKYRAEGNEAQAASVYGMFLYIYAILAAFILLAGGIIAFFSDRFYTVSTGVNGYRELKVVILLMVVNMALSFVNQPYSSIISSYERFTFIKITNLIYILLKPAIMIPLLIWGYKAVALSVVTMVLQQCLNIANVYYVRKVLHIKIDMNKKHMERDILKEIVGYSFFIFLCSIVGQLNDNTDKVILGIISGEVAVAVYSVGYTLNSYITQIPGVVSSVFFPRVTAKISHGATMDDMTDLMIRVGRIQYMVAFLLYSGFAFFGQEFVLLWAGEQYQVAYWIVLVLIIPAIIPNIQTLAVLIIQAMNKNQFRAVVLLACAISNVAFSIPAGLAFGPLGCAACTGATTFITRGIIMNWYYAKKIHLGIGRFWNIIFMLTMRLLPIIAVGFGLTLLPNSGGWMWLLLKLAIYTAVFCVYTPLVCFNREEKELFIGGIRKIIRR